MRETGPGNGAYEALIAKVDAFHHQVVLRHGSELVCRRGCDACCQVHLSVCAVEADRVRGHLRRLDAKDRRVVLERLEAHSESGRCIMLQEDGACAIYPVRPLVCRTQGLALRYPPGTFPDEAVMARGDDGSDIVWCPLNFQQRPPEGGVVMEAGRLEEMLMLINLEHVGGDRKAALDRVQLDQLVRRLIP